MTLPLGITVRKGSYVAYLTVNGKRIRQVVGRVGCTTPKEAAKERARLEAQIENGTFVPKSRASKQKAQVLAAPYTVADLKTAYLREYRNGARNRLGRRRKGKDAKRLEIAWNHLKPMFETLPASAVSTDLINQYVESRKAAGAQGGTINRELSLLKAAFNYGADITPPMVAAVPKFPQRLEENPPRQGFLTDQQYFVLAKNAKDLWLRCLVACAYSFGFRKGELLDLRVSDVDLFDRWIRLYEDKTKGLKPRKIKMTEEVFQLMTACCAGKQTDDFVFTRADGQHVVDPRDDWYSLCVTSGLGRWEPAKRKNGKDYNRYVGLNLHDFRRAAIRNMIRRGVGQKVAMDISGHTTISTFHRYNITDERDLEQASLLIEAGRQTQESVSETATKPPHPVLPVL